MTGNQKTIQWGRTHHSGPRNGAKPARNGGKAVSARQARLDGLATVLKGFLGTDSFISVRERGTVIVFRENGVEIAEASATQNFGDASGVSIDLVLEDETTERVALAAMSAQQGAVSTLDKGVRRKCWLVKKTGSDGRATYSPAGVAYVDGKAVPVREGAARSFVASQLAWAMTPKSKGGKRVKFNIRSKDGKGTRYSFRINGTDIAEFYHDGRFEQLGENARPIEHYLSRANIPCVEDSQLMHKLASCMVSPQFASDIDESVEPYDNDAEQFAEVSESAVEHGLIRSGKSIENFGVKVEKNKKTREEELVLFEIPPKADKRKLVDSSLDFGGSAPSEASPAERRPEGRPAQTTAVAAAQSADVPAAA